MNSTRRSILFGSAASLAVPALAQGRRPLAQMTDGPFYPPPAWRSRWTDWDADLTRVEQPRGAAQPLVAAGEHLGLRIVVADTAGRVVDRAEVEIWQCDARGAYRHPGVALEPGGHDPGFQGFGSTRSGSDGMVALRTIRPVPYPGRAPHIHVKLRHPAFSEVTSQLFVAGDPGNPRDGLWRRLDPADREALELRLQPAATGADRLRWQADHVLTVKV